MRVVDKPKLLDSEKLFVVAGKATVHAMLTGRPLSDFIIEDRQEVITAAMELPQAVRDTWFQAGVRFELKQTLKADAQRLLKNPDSAPIAYNALVKYLDYLCETDPKFTISARVVQPIKAIRKIVEHDKDGRIKSMLEIEESVVV